MTFSVTIDAVAVDIRAGSLHISQTANGRATASFEVLSIDRSYRPDLDVEVVIQEDGTTIFGGLVDRPLEKGMFRGSHPGIITRISAMDFNAYAERRYVNGTLAAGTLKSQLTTLVGDYLDDYGVTLHGSQVDGPSMPELIYEYRRLDEVLNELMTLTASAGEPYVWRISSTKALRAFQPSTDAAPFDLVGNDLSEVIGDIEVETSRGDGYANRIILKVPDQLFPNFTESKAGDDTWDEWVLTYPIAKHNRFIEITPGFFQEPLGLDHITGPTWTIDTDNQTLTRLTGILETPYVATIIYDGLLKITVIAEDAGHIATHGVWERVLVVEKVPSETTAQALADAELAKRLTETQRIRYKTWERGIQSGQRQTVNVSARNVNTTAVITEVVIRDLVHRLERSVTAVVDVGQTNLSKGWRDVYKAWLGDKSGTGSTMIPPAVVGTPMGAAPPDRSVQFNYGGVFGGDEHFIYYHEENSVVMGGDSSITALDFQSCLIAGYDCHIVDP